MHDLTLTTTPVSSRSKALKKLGLGLATLYAAPVMLTLAGCATHSYHHPNSDLGHPPHGYHDYHYHDYDHHGYHGYGAEPTDVSYPSD